MPPPGKNLGPNTYYTFDENYEPIDTLLVAGGVYQTYRHLDPRLKLQYKINPFASLKLSYGIYHQNIHQITNSTSPFTAMEIWLPSNPNIKPQSAHQVSLSYAAHLPKRKLEVVGELYYKKMNHQIDYTDHANTLLNPLIEGELRFGKIQSYGLELMLKKKAGALNGWLSYTYSKTTQQTPDINQGRSYPAFQDRPHDISLMLNYPLKKRGIIFYLLDLVLWFSFFFAYGVLYHLMIVQFLFMMRSTMIVFRTTIEWILLLNLF